MFWLPETRSRSSRSGGSPWPSVSNGNDGDYGGSNGEFSNKCNKDENDNDAGDDYGSGDGEDDDNVGNNDSENGSDNIDVY